MAGPSKARSLPANTAALIACILCSLLLIAVAIILIWYFVFRDGSNNTDPIAMCGDCYGSLPPNGTCPQPMPKTDYSDAIITQLKTQIPINPFELSCDPFEDGSSCVTTPEQTLVELDEVAVCGLHYVYNTDANNNQDDNKCTDAQYRMQSYPNWESAEQAGAFITHAGACGVCSTTQDLAVYLAETDLTTEASKCSKRALFSVSDGIRCFKDLGMTDSCARIWVYDGLNTAAACGLTCLGEALSEEDNNGPPPQCELNDCIQCDENESGPTFEAVAGRTRRRSGLLTAIARRCDELVNITQESCPETESLDS